MKHVDVVILGGGPAGISAAIWLKRLGINALLIEQNSELGGQLTKIQNEIIDYPGIYANNGKQLQKEFIEHFHRLGCAYQMNTDVLTVDPFEKIMKMKQRDQEEELHFRFLVIAAGAGDRRLGVPGEKEMLARGEHYSTTADRPLFKGKAVAVVGGGDRAFEGACLLAETAETVYLIHRSNQFKAQKQFRDQVTARQNIKVLTKTHVTAIHGKQRVTAVDLLANNEKPFTLKVDAVFVRIGVEANIGLFKEFLTINAHGLIAVDRVGTTSCNSIFAIGDICTDPLYSSISTSIGQGAITAKHIASLFRDK